MKIIVIVYAKNEPKICLFQMILYSTLYGLGDDVHEQTNERTISNLWYVIQHVQNIPVSVPVQISRNINVQNREINM